MIAIRDTDQLQTDARHTVASISEPERPVAIKIEHLSKTYPIPLARFKQIFRRKSAQGPTEALRDDERVRAQVGLASAEERTFYWRLTVEQNLLFFARLHGLRDAIAHARIEELLARFELTPLARKRFGELSTGNKQRMIVARALLNRPPVLLLDEPTRSLDPLAAARMRAMISHLAADEKVTVLLTSHNLTEIEELCARIAIISRGRICAVDTPAALRATHKQTEHVTLVVRGLPPTN